jgi:hypothetical protein
VPRPENELHGYSDAGSGKQASIRRRTREIKRLKRKNLT